MELVGTFGHRGCLHGGVLATLDTVSCTDFSFCSDAVDRRGGHWTAFGESGVPCQPLAFHCT